MIECCEVGVKSSYQDFLKVLEADIQYANVLAASIPGAKDGGCLQMKLVYNHLAPIFLFLLQWIDSSYTFLLSSCLNLFHIAVWSDGRPSDSRRKATIREFYAVILPSLHRLHVDSLENVITQEEIVKKKLEDRKNLSEVDFQREDECGICFNPCTKVVLPSCCHAMCIDCFHDWNTRSESCPFCRGSLKRVNSEDLWVLTCSSDVVDAQRVIKDDILQFYLYITSLPKDIPDALFLVYHDYLI